MPSHVKSLMDYLTLENPTISQAPEPENANPSPPKNTTHRRWLQPLHIEEWKDFTFESLLATYNGSLQKALAQQSDEFPDHSAIAPLPFCEIHDEKSFHALLVKWTQSIVCDALRISRIHLPSSHIPCNVYMASGGQAGRAEEFEPDWAGVLRTDNATYPVNILPGDTKLASKWSSSSIEIGNVDEAYREGDWIEPIRQIFTYCFYLNTRYGYIITEKELVVVRIGPSKPKPQSPDDSPDSSDSIRTPKEQLTSSSQDSSDSIRTPKEQLTSSSQDSSDSIRTPKEQLTSSSQDSSDSIRTPKEQLTSSSQDSSDSIRTPKEQLTSSSQDSSDSIRTPKEQLTSSSQASSDSIRTPKAQINPISDSAAQNFRPCNGIEVEKKGTLEFKAIPWKSKTGDFLTVNLALWWIHVMAMEKHDIGHSYPPLADATWSSISELQERQP